MQNLLFFDGCCRVVLVTIKRIKVNKDKLVKEQEKQ